MMAWPEHGPERLAADLRISQRLQPILSSATLLFLSRGLLHFCCCPLLFVFVAHMPDEFGRSEVE